MMTQHWIGTLNDDGEQLAWLFDGDACVGPAPKASDVLPLRFGAGHPEQVPAHVRDGGDGVLTQPQPAGVLPTPARLALVGLCRVAKDFEGTACVIQGGRSHWVQLSADEVVSFQSYLSPRLAQTLGAGQRDRIDEDALGDTLSRPERLATQLSSAELTANPGATLGHLLGAELSATRPYWLGARVALIATGPMAASYAQAFKTQGLMLEEHDLRDLQQQGMIAFNTQKDAV